MLALLGVGLLAASVEVLFLLHFLDSGAARSTVALVANTLVPSVADLQQRIDELEAAAAAAALLCNGGFYRPTAGAACVGCPLHSFSDGSAVGACTECDATCVTCSVITGRCTNCAAGSQSTGAACEVCPPGTYDDAFLDCTPCAAGTYATTSGATACTACSPGCLPTCTATGNGCATCAPGHGGTGCPACPTDTWSAGNSTDACTACPVGCTGAAGVCAATTGVCAACSAGYNGVPTCAACAERSFSLGGTDGEPCYACLCDVGGSPDATDGAPLASTSTCSAALGTCAGTLLADCTGLEGGRAAYDKCGACHVPDPPVCWGHMTAGRPPNPVDGGQYPGVPDPIFGIDLATPTLANELQLSIGDESASAGYGACATVAPTSAVCWGTSTTSSPRLGLAAPLYYPTYFGGAAHAAYAHDVYMAVASASTSCVITLTGVVYCMGDNTYGQLCIGQAFVLAATPVEIATDEPMQRVWAFSDRTFLHELLPSRDAYACGRATDDGLLGDGQRQTRYTPVAVLLRMSGSSPDSCRLADNAVIVGDTGGLLDVATGDLVAHGFTCIVIDNGVGRVYCWGSVVYATGTGASRDDACPFSQTPVLRTETGAPLTGVVQLTGSDILMTVCALLVDRTVVCWGDNTDGRTATGSLDATVPLATPMLGHGGVAAVNITRVSIGLRGGCATCGERVMCWGYADYGRLGRGATTCAFGCAVEPYPRLHVIASRNDTRALVGVNRVLVGGESVCADFVARPDAGHYCPANTTAGEEPLPAARCPVGYFCPEGTLVALPCPSNCSMFCDIIEGTCAECAPGTGNGTACPPCPAGTYSIGGSITEATCTPCSVGCNPAGACEVTSGECDACDAGYATEICEACAAGSFSGGGSPASTTTCSTCSIGCDGVCNVTNGECPSVCFPGYGGASCTACAPGTYSTGGSPAVCTPCSPGCTTTCAVTTGVCLVCAAGYGGGTTCPVCAAGSYGAGGASNSATCTACMGFPDVTTPAAASTLATDCRLCGAGVDPTLYGAVLCVTRDCAGTVGGVAAYDLCGVCAQPATTTCWGSDLNGALGNSNALAEVAVPVDVTKVGGSPTALPPVRAIGNTGMASRLACALFPDLTLACWGLGSSGQVGNGDTTTNNPRPVSVLATSGAGGSQLMGVVQVSTGEVHACAVLLAGSEVCWGSDASGQLGNGAVITGDQAYPVAVTGLDAVQASVACGALVTCSRPRAASPTGVLCWGSDANEQVGNGAAAGNQDTPVSVCVTSACTGGTKLLGATSVTAGGAHVCALLSSGEGVCWGQADNGRCGDDNTGPHTRDHAGTRIVGVGGVGTFAGITQLAATGTAHTCLVGPAPDYAAYCFGLDSNGQLGVSAGSDTLGYPAAVLSILGVGPTLGVAAVVPTNIGTCLVRRDGSASCWGRISEGSMGDNTPVGTTGNRQTITSFVSVATGRTGTPFKRATGLLSVTGGDERTCATYTAALDAGYYCVAGVATVCPANSYCPAGSTVATPCSGITTYAGVGAASQEQCA